MAIHEGDYLFGPCGLGLAYLPLDHVYQHVEGGRLIRALCQWMLPLQGLSSLLPQSAAHVSGI